MKPNRRYQTIPDRAVCFKPGCSFHREAHAQVTGHQVRVISGAMAIFGSSRQVKAGARA